MRELFNVVPKKFLRLFSESISYGIAAFFKRWGVSLVLLFLLLLFAYVISSQVFFTTNWLLIFLSCFCLAIIVIATYQFNQEQRPPQRIKGILIAISETIIIEEKQLLNINTDTEKINRSIEKLIQDIELNRYPFCIGLVHPMLVKRPRLFYLLRNLTSYRESIFKDVSNGYLLSNLVILRDVQSKKIDIEVLYGKGVMNADSPFSEFKKAFDCAIVDELHEDYIVQVCKIYLAIQGQGILDLLIENSDWSVAHRVIDDCERIFKDSISRVIEISKGQNNAAIAGFRKDLLSNFERYRGIIFLNQGKFEGAVRHIFKAIQINPYFPYTSYDVFKESFDKVYLAQVSLRTSEIVEGDEHAKNNVELKLKAIELLARTEFPLTPSFEDILKEIIARANSEQLNTEMEKILKSDFCAEPVASMIKGEVLKYLPRGKERHEKMYLERMPEVLKHFENVLRFDPDFLLMYTRIGCLKMIGSFYEKNEMKAELMMKEGMSYFLKGDDVYSRMGIH